MVVEKQLAAQGLDRRSMGRDSFEAEARRGFCAAELLLPPALSLLPHPLHALQLADPLSAHAHRSGAGKPNMAASSRSSCAVLVPRATGAGSDSRWMPDSAVGPGIGMRCSNQRGRAHQASMAHC